MFSIQGDIQSLFLPHYATITQQVFLSQMSGWRPFGWAHGRSPRA